MPDIESKASKAEEQETVSPMKPFQHGELDQETAAYANSTAIHVDKATNRRLFWMINRRVLVCMLATYFCQALDKGTLGFASIMGIQTDAHLVGNEYSWLGTILYIGVLAGEYPTNFLLQKLPVGKYIASNVFLWGVVIACSAAATNFPGLMAVRFLLGVFESCVQPCFILMTSMWYTRSEQTILTSLWYCMMGVQLMIGGLLAYGVEHYRGHSIKSWQLLFLVLGVATCAWALFMGWYLPDSPMKAKCWSEADKRLMVERVRANETGIQNRVFKKYQVLEVLRDPAIWLYALLQMTSCLIIGGLGVFSNIIIKSFGFTTLQTQLLNIAQGGVTIAVMVGGASLATWTKQTILTMHLWTIPAIIGTAIIFTIPPTPKTRAGLLIAFYCTQFILAEGNLLFSLISRNVAGQTKKSTVLAVTFIAWSASNAAAPQIFRSDDAPRYHKGLTAHFCLYALFNIILLSLRTVLMARNRKKRSAAAAAGQVSPSESSADEKIEHSNAFLDLTDKENPDFRCKLASLPNNRAFPVEDVQRDKHKHTGASKQIHTDAHYNTDSRGFLIIQGNFQRDSFLWQKIDLPELLDDSHHAHGNWPSNQGFFSQGSELENFLDTSPDAFGDLSPDSFRTTASLLPFESFAPVDLNNPGPTTSSNTSIFSFLSERSSQTSQSACSTSSLFGTDTPCTPLNELNTCNAVALHYQDCSLTFPTATTPASLPSHHPVSFDPRPSSPENMTAPPPYPPEEPNIVEVLLESSPVNSNASDALIQSVSKCILCEDYIVWLESELPRWTREGLWCETGQSLSPSAGTSRYRDLEPAYFYVLASTIGRGDATRIIDTILESIHEGWRHLSPKRQSDLRAKFHERKKYGKRWLLLADRLGPGILLLCSTKTANLVRNTSVTAKMLEDIASQVQASQAETMRTLAIINPLAQCLFRDEGYSEYDRAEILRQIRDMSFLMESSAVGQPSPLGFSNTLNALPGALVLYAALHSLYNIYLHSLSRFPGPKLWQTSYIFRHIASIRGTLDVSIKAFHTEYGPVVRYSPDELSFISAEAWRDIYGFRENALPKDPSFYGLIQLSRDKSPSIFTADQDHHPRVRKALSYAFSEKALRDQEPFVKHYVDLLIQRLRGIADAEDNRVDLVKWYNFTTFDIIGDLAIGRSFDCLQDSAYHSWVDAFWKSIKISPYARAMATYTDVPRLLRLFAPRALKEARLRRLQYVGVHMEERLARGILRDKPDFISYILRSKGTADELTDGEVEANVSFLLLAGTETTATALSGTTYYLLKNPEGLRKATAEVRSAYNSEDEITFATTAERLPYMQACLTEGLRIYPSGPIAAPRRTPRGTVTWIAGHP
ncbi:hypothetical protein KXV71_003371, partial [Aspergillus fumigatus]